MTITEERRRELVAEHREKIAKGEIDLGPMPVHDDVIEDQRDLRDPERLGEMLLNATDQERDIRVGWPDADKVRASRVYDAYGHALAKVPDYEQGFVDHSKLRRDELEARAANGDRFAAALLRGDSLAEDPVD